MKIALMILFVFGGFVMSSVSAQSCAPCPPECCVAACKPAAKGSASLSGSQADVASLAAFSPEAMAAACQDKKMTKKEMKDCQAVCLPACNTGAQTASPVNASPVANSPAVVNQKPALACKPGKG